MSTYLVAFANGHFEHLESSYKSPLSGKTIPLRMYGELDFVAISFLVLKNHAATPEIIHQTAFALDVKAKVMPIYERVFQLEYPLPKLDTLVAHDFDFGAMENWYGILLPCDSRFTDVPIQGLDDWSHRCVLDRRKEVSRFRTFYLLLALTNCIQV